MGKPIAVEIKRKSFCAMLSPRTIAVIQREAKRLGVSQGELIDAAFVGTETRQGAPIIIDRSPIQPRDLTVEYDA
jgi:hypothetical protein